MILLLWSAELSAGVWELVTGVDPLTDNVVATLLAGESKSANVFLGLKCFRSKIGDPEVRIVVGLNRPINPVSPKTTNIILRIDNGIPLTLRKSNWCR